MVDSECLHVKVECRIQYLMLFAVKAVNPISLGLAWFFVISRYIHAVVHIGRNYVPVRMKIFAIGIVALLGMAIVVMCKILPVYLESLGA